MKLFKAILPGVLMATIGMVPGAAQTPDQPQQAPAPRLGTKPQELYLTKITVSDLKRSLDFYTGIIGLKLVTVGDIKLPKPPAPGDPEKEFVEVPLNYTGSMADPLIVLMKRKGKTPSPEFTSLVTIGFKVPSTRATMDRAAQAGHKPLRPFTGEGGVGLLTDPDGYTIELVQAPSFENR
jgi:catechol 2,3-dioxygenase-like lactoylglutathione lyase family enzyme